MAELAPAEVYAPGPNSAKSLQVWKTLMSWLGFVLQILRGTPSWAQVLSFLGVRYSLLWSSSPPFRPLPTNALTDTSPSPLVVPGKDFDKLTVVLDLDETLVSAFETSGLPSVVRNQAIKAGLKCFELECVSVEEKEFLQQISEFADLVLFTAGLEGYARPLVDRIDVDSKFSVRLYRPSTVTTKYREHVKDLASISRDPRRIVIVDNSPFSFLLQPLNGIPCVPFSARQPYDDQLMGFLLPLLKNLSLQKDVRPILHEKYNMPEWFKQHGIPTSDCTL